MSVDPRFRSLGERPGSVDALRTKPMTSSADPGGDRTPLLTRPGFVFELKFDGVRALADPLRGILVGRSGRRIELDYPEVLASLAPLSPHRALFDGEIIAVDADGRPSFAALQPRIMGNKASVDVTFVAFDVLAVGGFDLRAMPLLARRDVLTDLLSPHVSPTLRISEAFDDGRAVFAFAEAEDLEGILAKRADSPYTPGPTRTGDWIKIKRKREADFIVSGWTAGEGSRRLLGALELATFDGAELVLRGRVGSGLSPRIIEALLPLLHALEVKEPVARGRLPPAQGRRYVKPLLVVNVTFAAWTRDGLLRMPVFSGVRDDVLPEDCRARPESAP